MSTQSKILIAEDDLFLKKIMRNRLEEEGFTVDVATDGDEAIKKLKANHYSLILLDLVMPIKNGFQVLAELKAMNNQIPVLVFSNLSQAEDKEEVIALGAKAFYVKSNISIDELTEVVQSYLY